MQRNLCCTSRRVCERRAQNENAFDRYNTDAHAIGQGALDSYLTAMGVRFGLESKKESAATTAAVKGEYAAVGAARPHIGVTAEELAQEMARSAGG